MAIIIDKKKCIGCGACAAVAPEVFEMGDDGKSQIVKGKIDMKKAKEGADTCPVQAIKV